MVEFGNNEQGLGVSEEELRKRQAIRAKRAPDALDKKWQQGDLEDLELAERMMAPPVITEPRCHVCSGPFSQYRFWIERQLLKNRSYAAIAANIPADSESGRKLGWRSIKNHQAEHMPLDQAVIRAIMEEEADLIQQNYEQGVRGAFTMRGALEVLIRKAYQNAMDNIITIEARDLIQMVKLHNDLNANSGTVAMEEAKAVVRIYTEAIREVLDHGEIVSVELGQELKVAISLEVDRLRAIEEITYTGGGLALEPAVEIVDATVLDIDG